MFKIIRHFCAVLPFIVVLTLSPRAPANDYFAIVVGGVEFHIKKEQLPPLERGRGKISEIKAYKPESPGEFLRLNEIEAVAGIPEQSQLVKFDSSPLEYLLIYGSESTKKHLQHYYPVNLISERDGHLVADVDCQDYPVKEECTICSQPLLSRHSLTHCTDDKRHIFHTACLQFWLQQLRYDINPGEEQTNTTCPVCKGKQSQQLCSLLSREGMKMELHRAADAGESSVIKALLEAQVDLEAKDQSGNTALHLAAQAGHSDIVLLLTDFGVTFEAENHAGQLLYCRSRRVSRYCMRIFSVKPIETPISFLLLYPVKKKLYGSGLMKERTWKSPALMMDHCVSVTYSCSI